MLDVFAMEDPPWSSRAPLLAEFVAYASVEQYRALHTVAAYACIQKGHRETQFTLNDLPLADMVTNGFSRAHSGDGVLLVGSMLRDALARNELGTFEGLEAGLC